MTSIRPLDLASVERLGLRARTCVYWQTDDLRGQDDRHGHDDGDGQGDAGEFAAPPVADPEFEKEAWISRVSLEWGVCGQLAIEGNQPAGAAFYAPPAMVPRSSCFPTSPVGSDAVLLAGLIEEPSAPAGVLTALLGEVVEDLRGRGIKAIETFGVTSADTGVVTSRDNCGAVSCVTPSSFLIEHGFTIVADHETHPRLRLEIESEHQWKADVEHALDQLFAERGFATRRIGALSGASLRAH